MNKLKTILTTGILFFLFIILSSCSQTESGSSYNNKARKFTDLSDDEELVVENKIEKGSTNLSSSNYSDLYLVSRVVDGDTIEVVIRGQNEKIRLIGIDTPEIVDSRKTVQCFGGEASEKAKSLLGGQKIRLEADPSQGDRDKYNRLLRYVFLEDGTFFNEIMINEGYAHEYTYQSNPYKYQKEFVLAEKEARENNRGLWSPDTCGGKTNQLPVKASVEAEISDNQNCIIKGNIGYKTGEKIYHLPGCDSYKETVINERYGERWFCTEKEARDAGWRKAYNCP